MQNLIPSYCDVLGIQPELLKSRAKSAPILKKRYAIYHFLRYQQNLSYKQIGKLVGRDHSTIISSLKSFEKQLAADKDLCWWYAEKRDQFTAISQRLAA